MFCFFSSIEHLSTISLLMTLFFSIYSPDHNDSNRATRQQELRDSLMFTCDCLACVRNYPFISVWDMKRQHGFIKPQNHMKLCEDFKIDEVKTLLPRYYQYLNEHSEDYPYNYTNVAEVVLQHCLRLLYIDEVPLVDKQRLQLY